MGRKSSGVVAATAMVTAAVLGVATAVAPVTAGPAVPSRVAVTGSAVSSRVAVTGSAVGAKPIPTGEDPLGVMASRATRLVRKPSGIYGAEYAELRVRIAEEVGARLGIAPARFVRAWERASHQHQIAVMYALSQIGVRYEWGMESPGEAMDCSGLTWLAWRAAGLWIPRFSEAQYDRRLGIERSRAYAGDLVGADTHVRMWLGVDNATIESTTARGGRVSIANHSSSEARRWQWSSPMMIEAVRSGDVAPVATPTRLMFG